MMVTYNVGIFGFPRSLPGQRPEKSYAVGVTWMRVGVIFVGWDSRGDFISLDIPKSSSHTWLSGSVWTGSL